MTKTTIASGGKPITMEQYYAKVTGNPVRNFRFDVVIDGQSVGFMCVQGLHEGQTTVTLMRGITLTEEDLILREWKDAKDVTIIVRDGEGTPQVVFYLDHATPAAPLAFSDLDAGANNLMVQQLALNTEIRVKYYLKTAVAA